MCSKSAPKSSHAEEHGLRTPNEAFFHQSPKLLSLGRKFGKINFWAFGLFLADLSATILSMFSINQQLFLQKTKPLYPNPKYLFGIGIGIGILIWAAMNYGFSHRVSIVRGCRK